MSKPKVLIVGIDEADFFKTKHKDFLELLEPQADLHWACKGPEAEESVAQAKDYRAILLVDPGLKAGKYTEVVRKLVAYVRDDGGIVICMGLFAAFINYVGIDRFFGEGWDQPWTSGEYLQTDYVRNPNITQFDGKGLDDIYNQKALCLSQVSRDSALYVPVDGAFHEQQSFMPHSMRNIIQAAIIYEKLGEGHLGFVGDAEGEPETNKVILAMAGFDTS